VKQFIQQFVIFKTQALILYKENEKVEEFEEEVSAAFKNYIQEINQIWRP